MLKILINNEEVVCDKQLEIKEEMLSTSSCILNNCYPKSWENTKDYTNEYYYPKDYSKCLIYNSKEPQTISQSGTTLTFDDLINPTLQDLQIKGNTYQNTSILPNGYTQVDYIESSGTQYIDSGILPSENIGFEIDFTPHNDMNKTTARTIFGSRTTWKSNGYQLTTYTEGSLNGGHFLFGTNNTASLIRHSAYMQKDVRCQISFLNGVFKAANGDETNIQGTFSNVSKNIYLFGCIENRPFELSTTTLYRLKFYDNGNLVRDFIPCYRNSDNVVGLYDLVNNVFYTNQGTGAFTYGSVINIPNPDYPQNIETITGEQNVQIINSNGAINYPLSLGSIELCKIGDYQDYIYKQDGNWYLHKEINKYIFEGNTSIDNYVFSTDLANVLAVNLIPNKVDQAVIRINNKYNLYSEKFYYINNTSNIEHIYISGPTPIPGGFYGNIRLYINHERLSGYSSSLTNNQKRDLVVSWLQQNPLTTYYIARYPEADTQIIDTTLISQLEAISIAKGNNYITTGNNTLPFDISMEIYDSGVDLLFSGIVKNTGNINLNPRYPHYCNLEVLDFKTFLSECDQLDFVINDKTITEAIEQVTQAVASYGFVVGNININDNTIIGAYSTQEKTPYDVFQYLADISQSRWYTRTIDENTVAIDFYDPVAMQRGRDLDFSNNTFACQNNIEDLSFNYGTYDYRNKQIMLSNQVFGGVDFEETIIADGYSKTFNTTTPIGILKGITVNGSSVTFATNEDKEMGVEADFYYTPGNTQIESNENDGTYTANTVIIVGYTPLVKGRQVISDTTEISRIATQIGRNGTISRYEKRNDVLSSDELELIGNSYLKYKGTPEINLTVVTKDYDLYNIGQIVYFNYPNIEELSQDYMVKSKKTRIINTATDWNIWYTYTLTSNFNSENAINYFDNQRAKSTGNIQMGDYITRNVDIEESCMIIFSNPTATEMSINYDNILNAPLNAPFTK